MERKIWKITEASVIVAAVATILIRLTRVFRLFPTRSAPTNEPASQEIHRKLDRIESALTEIELALKEDDIHSYRTPRV